VIAAALVLALAVPGQCTPDLNAPVAQLLAGGGHQQVDNVLVCGTTISSSRTLHGGEHGDHQVLPLRVLLPGGGAQLIEVVTNDALDGRVTAPRGVTVFAYGQFYSPAHHPFVAGVHDTHCSTHRSADNGWVSVDGVTYPKTPCRPRRYQQAP
jgi:hypothetical protein